MFSRLHFGVVAFVISMFLLGPVYGVPTGLVHHFNFDEGPDWHEDVFASVSDATIAIDSVGSADAAFQNMNASAWVSGVQFTCLKFDGTNDHLLTTSDLSTVLGGNTSLEYWVKTTGVSLAGITGSDEIQWGAIDASGRVSLIVDGSVVITSAEAINDGKWHHIVITRNASTGFSRIYVDGSLSSTSTGTAGIKSTPFYSIAKVEGSGPGSGYFSGRLDQIHIYNKIINAATIAEIMDNHAPKTWPKTTAGTNTAPFSTASVFFNSYDVEQDTLSVTSFGQPANGTVTYNGDGTFTYTAGSGFVGYDSFEVTIEDGKGGFTRSMVTVSVADDAGLEGDKRTTIFGDFQALQAGGSTISLSGKRVPRAIDWNNDSLKDMLVGHSGAIWRYMNTGSASSPVFAAGVRVKANGSNISLSGTILIALADMTGDGVDDLVAVSSNRKVRVYRNTSASGQIPVYAASSYVKQPNGSDFVLPDQRFDAGDWDGDGLNDVIMGNRSGEVRAYRNVGTAATAKFDSDDYEVLTSGSYNLYPRLFDISRNGVPDYIQGINWGSISYWFDPQLNGGLVSGGTLVVTDSTGATVDMKAATDGAAVDFADFNGDGVYDLIAGGYAGSNIFIAYGKAKTVADIIADNEAIYDANAGNLGPALEANNQELLGVINSNSRAIISHMQAATLPERQQMFAQMVAHVGRYSFLQMNAALNTTTYNHVPSIAGQNLMTMHQMLPDTPTHRVNVADAVGLTGTLRDIYIESFLHLGENNTAPAGQLESVRDFMSYIPREIFPDSLVTLNHYWGNGRGGTVNSFRGAKNTFNWGEGSDTMEVSFRSDMRAPIESVLGTNSYRGDYFTFVLGHEATHSLDGYVNRCANKDLRRRWGQFLVLAGGPDIVAGTNGWIDWTATKAHFQTEGYWDGVSANWNTAWEAYWATGPGSAWNGYSFMRGGIDWFFGAPQESLATQANQSYANSEGRLIGALDRWRRGVESGIEPLKANLTECVTYIDFTSAGLNKIVMYDTHGISTPYPHTEYNIYPAWLERNDKGYITKITMNGHVYDFTLDAGGIITDVNTNIFEVNDDHFVAFGNKVNIIDVLANDTRIEGGHPELVSYSSVKGTLTDNGDGRLIYTPPGSSFLGTVSFTYTAAMPGDTTTKTATVTIDVVEGVGAMMETFTGISGTAVSDLTSSGKYPDGPDSSEVVNEFQAPWNYNNNYGVRMYAWLTVPATGSYTFWIASDDNGQLRLSSDAYPINSSLIASVPGYTNIRQWDKYTEQRSAPIDLIEGQMSYIEALMKEGTGGDNLAVAWQGPGITQAVIAGQYLKPFYVSVPEFTVDPLLKNDAIEGQDYSDSVAGDATDPGGQNISFQIVAGPGWLDVSDDGLLSGIAPDADVGANDFTIRATLDDGGYADASLQITVQNMFTGELGLYDFAWFSANWLSSSCVDEPGCGGSDLSGDGDVDIEDMVIFCEFWLNQKIFGI